MSPTLKAIAKPINRTRLITAALLIALLAVMAVSTTYVAGDDVAATGKKSFDAEEYGAANYESKIVPAIEKDAVDITTLAVAVKDDPDAAGEQYGHRDGGSPYTYPVTLKGVAGQPEGGLLPIAIAGLDNVKVSVQIGPAINGTALRDATGLVKFNDFVNQVEYADSAIALNRLMAADVLSSLDVAGLAGETITVVGATSPLNPELFTITPIKIEVAS